MKTTFLALVFAFVAAVAGAQTTTCTANCTANKSQSFTVVADHDGVDVDGFRLRQNGTIVRDVPVSALAGGSISFPFVSGLSNGTYTFSVSAYNTDDPVNETLAVSITLVVKRGKPVAPANTRITK